MCPEGWGVFERKQEVVILSVMGGGYAYDSEFGR